MATLSEKKVDFVKFNFDCMSLLIGMKSGIRLYCLKTARSFYVELTSKAVVVERLNDSSLLAVVTLSNLKKLQFMHMQKNRIIWSKQYPKTILSVQMNSEVAVVCLQDSIVIHNMRNMEVIHSISNIPEGCSQMSVLSNSLIVGKYLLVYPCSEETGNIRVFDISKKIDVTTIHAHENPIAMMVMNRQQTLIAAASTKGTVIRLISLPDGTCVKEFRRGISSAEIYSITFSNNSKFLCCSSSSGTTHVFSLVEENKPSTGWFGFLSNTIGSTADYMLSSNKDLTIRESEQDWMSYFSDKIISSTTYVPQTIYSQWTKVRSFARARIPRNEMKCIGAVYSFQKELVILVASENGSIYTFKSDPVTGGDGVPLQTIDFTEESDTITCIESMLMDDDDRLRAN